MIIQGRLGLGFGIWAGLLDLQQEEKSRELKGGVGLDMDWIMEIGSRVIG